MEKIKCIDLKDESYLFETLDQLVEMLKDEYEVTLNIRKKGKLKQQIVKL